MTLTARGEMVAGTAAVLTALLGLPWTAAALGTWLAGPDPEPPGVVVLHGEEETATPVASPTAPSSRVRVPRATPSAASRSRSVTADPTTGTGSHLNWRALRDCESSNNYTDRDSTTYRGAYQFDRQTWQSVGGAGDPAAASPSEQDMRARLLYVARGRQPWPVCGRYL